MFQKPFAWKSKGCSCTFGDEHWWANSLYDFLCIRDFSEPQHLWSYNKHFDPACVLLRFVLTRCQKSCLEIGICWTWPRLPDEFCRRLLASPARTLRGGLSVHGACMRIWQQILKTAGPRSGGASFVEVGGYSRHLSQRVHVNSAIKHNGFFSDGVWCRRWGSHMRDSCCLCIAPVAFCMVWRLSAQKQALVSSLCVRETLPCDVSLHLCPDLALALGSRAKCNLEPRSQAGKNQAGLTCKTWARNAWSLLACPSSVSEFLAKHSHGSALPDQILHFMMFWVGFCIVKRGSPKNNHKVTNST